jgi:hypothetical protein
MVYEAIARGVVLLDEKAVGKKRTMSERDPSLAPREARTTRPTVVLPRPLGAEWTTATLPVAQGAGGDLEVAAVTVAAAVTGDSAVAVAATSTD